MNILERFELIDKIRRKILEIKSKKFIIYFIANIIKKKLILFIKVVKIVRNVEKLKNFCLILKKN